MYNQIPQQNQVPFRSQVTSSARVIFVKQKSRFKLVWKSRVCLYQYFTNLQGYNMPTSQQQQQGTMFIQRPSGNHNSPMNPNQQQPQQHIDNTIKIIKESTDPKDPKVKFLKLTTTRKITKNHNFVQIYEPFLDRFSNQLSKHFRTSFGPSFQTLYEPVFNLFSNHL